MNRWQQFKFVVADQALLLSRWVEQKASRQLEILEPPDPMGRTLQERWRIGFEQFCMYSEMDFRDPKDGKVKPIEFSQRHMERAGICDRDVWEIFKRVGVNLRVLVVIPSSGTYPAIRTHTRKTRTQESRPVSWSRGALRAAFQAGVFQITPLPYPDSEPPHLNELRSTVAQSPRRGLIRTVGTVKPKAPYAVQTIIQPVQKPEIQPYTGYTDEPEWLRFSADRVCRILAAHRYRGNLDVVRIRGNDQVFTVHLIDHCIQENLLGLRDDLALGLGVGGVGMYILPMPKECYVTITAPVPAGAASGVDLEMLGRVLGMK